MAWYSAAAPPPSRNPHPFADFFPLFNLPLTLSVPCMSSKLSSLLPIACAAVSCLFASCKTTSKEISYTSGPDTPPRAVVRDGVAITLRDQKLTVFREGKKVKDYDISSSKFGIGNQEGSNHTPTGIHAVAKKVGEGQPTGMVFRGCRPTGEVVPVDAEGRDPIVTRIIQLSGLEGDNRNSHSRRIYIHGTPEERNIGKPASYGCIRMKSADVIDLYRRVHRGMPVAIERCSQAMYLSAEKNDKFQTIAVPQEVVASLPTDDGQYRPSARRGKAYNSRGKQLVTRKMGRKSRRLATRKRR